MSSGALTIWKIEHRHLVVFDFAQKFMLYYNSYVVGETELEETKIDLSVHRATITKGLLYTGPASLSWLLDVSFYSAAIHEMTDLRLSSTE